MARQYHFVTSDDLSISSPARTERQSHGGANLLAELHQELPPLFASRAAGILPAGEQPLASVFVASEQVLEQRIPARALVLTEDGVLFLEAGELVLGDMPWGVKSLFLPYAQITAVGLGTALLTGRFTLHSHGSAPLCEISLHSHDLPRFEAVARLIRQKIADEGR